MRGKGPRAGFAVLAATLLFASCSETAPSPGASAIAGPSATETPRRGGQLVYGLATDIVTLQPILAVDNPSAQVWSLNYAGLLGNDPATGDLRPGLAESFSMSADNRRVTYILRAGLVWSDGVPLTGEDYRFTVEATARSRKTTQHSFFQDIVGWSDYVTGQADSLRGINITDAGRTIQIDLVRGRCSALGDMAPAIIPRHRFITQWDPRTTDMTTSIDDAAFNRAPPVASGPFIFAEYRPGDQIRLVRNERFWKGAPFIDEVVFRIFPDQVTSRLAFLSGEISVAGVAPGDVEDTRKRMGANAVDFRLSGVGGQTYLALNTRSATAPWLADKRVRQALWYGLDTETMLQATYFGYAHRISTFTPDTSWAYDPTGLDRHEFDRNRARVLLENAGARLASDGLYRWTDGRTVEMKIEVGNNTAPRVTFTQAMTEQLRAIGIKATIVVQPFNALVARLQAHDPTVESYVITTGLSPDLTDTFEMWHSSQMARSSNNSGFSDPALDRAVEAGMFGPDCSVAARRAAYHQMDLVLNDAAPFVLLFTNDNVQFRSSRLVAPPPMPYGTRYDLHTWWFRTP